MTYLLLGFLALPLILLYTPIGGGWFVFLLGAWLVVLAIALVVMLLWAFLWQLDLGTWGRRK